MCGLVCVISKQKSGFTFKDKTIFLQMLIADMFRGMDSTGVYAVNKYGNLNMVKDASHASLFINKKEANTFFNDFISDYHIVVGHNRKATMGGVQAESAHPFIEGNICLVHNGTLQNHYKLANRTVDSNAIAAHINENGYKSLLKNIEGAYALIWYNAEEKTLYFTRNAERPLHLVETNEKIYLTSESKMLDWILDRNDIPKYTIQNVPTDKVFKFNLETRKLEAESKPKKAEPPKNKHYPTQQEKNRNFPVQVSGATKIHSDSGQSVSTYSSGSSTNKATIETYSSGQRINWRLLNWEVRANSYKFDGETTDQYRTPVSIFLDMKQYSQVEVDDFINAEWLQGIISTISWKANQLKIYLKNIATETRIRTMNNKNITIGQVNLAGGACYSCGSVLDTKEDIADAVISVNSRNEIQYITCGSCCGGHPYANCCY